MIEIERKFLLRSKAFKTEAFKQIRITQGFLNRDPQRTVRVRITENDALLTVKGISSNDGLSRFEWEKNITKTEANKLLELCEKGIIDKMRYYVNVGAHIYEIDEFYGDNQGLTIAEIELNSKDESFEKPLWLGQEITGDIKYYNSYLSKHPYKEW
jgi:adenylate cyclase